MTYVLREAFVSEKQGRPFWYAGDTGIGPMHTDKPGERIEFESEEAARRCPVVWHPLSFYEVERVEEGGTDG
jgi:hypothetical protein